jgi:hypothetical protein
LQNVITFYESLQTIDAVIEVVLDLIEIAFVVVGDLLWDVAS